MSDIESPTIEEITALLDQLSDQSALVREALMAERRALYYASPQMAEGLDLQAQRQRLADFATTFMAPLDDEVLLERPLSGLMCVSSDTLALIEALNATKEDLRSTVVAYRAAEKSRAQQDRGLLERIAPGDAGVFERFSSMPPGERVDWWRAYAKIRVIDPSIRSISYTWATQQTQTIKVSYEKALSTAEQIQNEGLKAAALEQLGRINPSDPLVFHRPQKRQLRANFIYQVDGKTHRSSAPISGVMVVARDHLPQMVWHEPRKAGAERIVRSDRVITEPVVPALNLYIGRERK